MEHAGAIPSERMAGRIVRLPDHVVDQIAAGEVIERPASVVKELVENALDAGATYISIDCAGGGAKRVLVTDNGSGMSQAEAHLALMRHATSKLRTTEDLLALATHGFRGEALPSIASVSRFTLTTRQAQDVGGIALRVEGGQVVGQSAVGAPVGTSIEVRDLLFNQPARQKFMKSGATELSHISDWVMRLALAHPEVGFSLRHEGRELLEVASASQRDRLLALLGVRLQPHLLETVTEMDGLRIRAYLADASQGQPSSRGLHLFVGRRWVRDRGLAHAVAMAYGDKLPRGRYPLGAVFVDAPPGRSDINVHPQKLEVRFDDASAVYVAVRRALRPVVDTVFAPIVYDRSVPRDAATASSVALSSAMAARYVAGMKPSAVAHAAPIAPVPPQTALHLPMPNSPAPARTPAPTPAPVAALVPAPAQAPHPSATASPRSAPTPAPRLQWAQVAPTFDAHAVYWSRFVVGACDAGMVVIDMRRAVTATLAADAWPQPLPKPPTPRALSHVRAWQADQLLEPLTVQTLPDLLTACAPFLSEALAVLDAEAFAGLIAGSKP